jgi:hypothetical protein
MQDRSTYVAQRPWRPGRRAVKPRRLPRAGAARPAAGRLESLASARLRVTARAIWFLWGGTGDRHGHSHEARAYGHAAAADAASAGLRDPLARAAADAAAAAAAPPHSLGPAWRRPRLPPAARCAGIGQAAAREEGRDLGRLRCDQGLRVATRHAQSPQIQPGVLGWGSQVAGLPVCVEPTEAPKPPPTTDSRPRPRATRLLPGAHASRGTLDRPVGNRDRHPHSVEGVWPLPGHRGLRFHLPGGVAGAPASRLSTRRRVVWGHCLPNCAGCLCG